MLRPCIGGFGWLLALSVLVGSGVADGGSVSQESRSISAQDEAAERFEKRGLLVRGNYCWMTGRRKLHRF